ncbi:unnamed protein product [Coffea canephora]|uniref:Uncharacterized protein n=1 Tax=Coffea canephora TaxID=49390 RepID=A0A068U2I3_COFCA|nr:unnamed protein product [Coffea canephora]
MKDNNAENTKFKNLRHQKRETIAFNRCFEERVQQQQRRHPQ